MAEQQHHQQGRPARLPAQEQQQQQQQPQGPPAPLPAPVPREITQNDYYLASQTVKRRGFPIPGNAPDVENTFWEFEMTDTTGNRQWDLVKLQCYNRSNLVGNKRRDILPLLNKKKKRHILKLLDKYRNELQGLEAHLQAKINDFDQFVPGGFIMPAHFCKFPALK